MKKFFLSGILHPERAVLNVSNIEHEFLAPNGEKQGRIKSNIYNNQITAFLEWEDDNEDIYTLKNVTKAAIELTVNIVGFLKGYAYDVEIVKIFDGELNLSYVFGIQIPALEERNKTRDASVVNHLLPLCFGQEGVFLRRSLGDLNLAIKHPEDTAFYCFRALESLKQYFGFVTELTEDREQWEAMARAIDAKSEDIAPIRELAFPARHGVPPALTDEKRKSLFLLTWDLVERFIDFRLKQAGSNHRLQPIGCADGEASETR